MTTSSTMAKRPPLPTKPPFLILDDNHYNQLQHQPILTNNNNHQQPPYPTDTPADISTPGYAAHPFCHLNSNNDKQPSPSSRHKPIHHPKEEWSSSLYTTNDNRITNVNPVPHHYTGDTARGGMDTYHTTTATQKNRELN